MKRKILGTSSIVGTYSLKTTILKDVVEKLSLKSGDKIVFIEENNKIVIEKA